MGDLDHVGPKINDLDDLEDQLEILEPVVKELKSPQLAVPEIEIVKNKQLLNQYIALEDSLIQGFELLTDRYQVGEEKERLHDCESPKPKIPNPELPKLKLDKKRHCGAYGSCKWQKNELI